MHKDFSVTHRVQIPHHLTLVPFLVMWVPGCFDQIILNRQTTGGPVRSSGGDLCTILRF